MGGINGKHSIQSSAAEDATHELTVRTGHKKGAGARNVNIHMSFTDSEGNASPEMQITHWGKDDFRKAKENLFKVTLPKAVGKIKEISIRRDETGHGDAWHVEKIDIQTVSIEEGTTIKLPPSVFPVHRWIHANTTLHLMEYDSVLPQCDKHAEQRRRELEDKRDAYLLAKKTIYGAPPQVEILPDDEQFSAEYTFDIIGEALKMKAKTTYVDLTTPEFKSLKDVESIYKGVLPVPAGIHKWKSDVEFGNQKLAGCNPAMIELCQKIPEHMPVTNDMVADSLEGQDLPTAISNKKIYIIDLRFLADIECSRHRRVPGSTCLLYVRKNGELVPIAIQLMPTPADDNPIFTPSDPEYTWLSAKMWFNLGECSHHQSATHLGFTHLLKEAVAVVSHRQLSVSHPIFRLLAPHFIFLLPINALAISKLVSPGGWVDKAMHVGRTGMFNIIKKKWDDWHLEKDGNIIKMFAMKGTDDVEALPNYQFRDDATLLWNAIERYVAGVVSTAYDTPDKMANDHEIQNWCRELVDEAGFKGFPKGFTSNEQLVEVVTTFIYIGSVGHAAANFGQYDEYAFPPNYPSALRGERPTSKDALTEEDIVNNLPLKDQALEIIFIMKILSQRGTNELANFEVQYGYEPGHIEAWKRFKEELAEICVTIDKRNEGRVMKYPYLNPREVPNAISI